MKIYKIAQERSVKVPMGRKLNETGYQYSVATIYRAVPATVMQIDNMDYVTMSRKFAKEHSDHMVVTEEEDFHVLQATVKSVDVAEASNPGEFYYIGEVPVTGKIIYESKVENMYG